MQTIPTSSESFFLCPSWPWVAEASQVSYNDSFYVSCNDSIYLIICLFYNNYFFFIPCIIPFVFRWLQSPSVEDCLSACELWEPQKERSIIHLLGREAGHLWSWELLLQSNFASINQPGRTFYISSTKTRHHPAALDIPTSFFILQLSRQQGLTDY